MSFSRRAAFPITRAVKGLGHALAEDARRHPSTPMHESLALGLGLAPTAGRREYAGRR